MSDIKLYVAIRRRKDNKDDIKERSIRHIIRDEVKDLKIIESIINQQEEKGIWRIYKTVNARDTEKAHKEFIHKSIEDPISVSERVESVWKTCLLQPKCKSENRLLLDIDTLDEIKFNNVMTYLNTNNIHILENIITPNGHHIVINRQDIREIKNNFDFVEVKKDALMFVSVIKTM